MTRLKTLHMAVAAGSLAVVVSGCGTMDRMTGSHMSDRDRNYSTDRSSDRAGSADRAAGSSDRMAAERAAGDRGMTTDRSGYSGGTASSGTPASVDPFSRGYVPFPASANESPGIIGQSAFCIQHYNQPGCQTGDSPMDQGQRYYRDRRS